MPPKYTWFCPEEVVGLDPEFVAMLDRARGLAQTPFFITSGFRSPGQNESLPNAVSDSAHLSGLAADILCTGSQERFQIVKALVDVGFTRIGAYTKHVHCDSSKVLPQNVFWIVDGA